MKTLIIMAIIFSTLAYKSYGQQVPARKTRFPIGFYTTGESNIYGLSVGIGSDTYQNSKEVSVISNGIRIEPLSQSLLIFTLFFFSPDEVHYPREPKDFESFDNKVPNEIINGLNISCGTNAFANLNGITLSAISQTLKNSNGISLSCLGSGSFCNNGIQIAGAGTRATYSNGIIVSALNTEVHRGRGVQIGGFNQYVDFRGLQVGVFNDVETKAEDFRGVQIGIFNNAKKLKGIQIGLINRNEKRILPFINWNFKD
jgi:hypothetical protein